ncbi:alpha-L-fucosidase [Algoriphagus halophytocola]|uniref:alpha-L-fucosidase n=1 Tax=Algoriphagus halophytocola TaxID=2991499 RepID=A0ABY6MJH8_9BACT|nr:MULTISPECIES: alpha-L-fucosidase [unclassified Algoriphagus]UZD23200.1 alpha-L-fucosidase [Algoriphagus sp. TR-M5]WBL44493.1 alpha-L-fucosidase [Algoriphagus sp. TR-M9]
MFNKFSWLVAVALSVSLSSQAQNTLHPTSASYEYPTDPKVAEKLEHWRDQKFGILIHWGIYAVPGIVESWSIVNEDWINRKDTTQSYEEYKKWYWGLKDEFNPKNFDPGQWADAAEKAGMKYLVFTTKHHDGFNMFDTQYTDYKITDGPFKDHPKANVAKHVFEAFREKNMMIGAYYSKPDWHSQYYWWDYRATPDRNVNYDIRKHPWRWNQYVQFTHNQLDEITSNYGEIDILWLDGGWVRPLSTVNEEVLSWGAPIPEFSQEINMPKVAEMVRNNQEGMLIVDRTVHGPFENYRTPEQGIPAEMSSDPWESCITLGGAWGYVPNDKFKPSRKVIHLLIEIVAKGGNLLLGVGPTADGLFLPEQVSRLEEIGAWLEKNGAGIYNTRAVESFQDGNIYFTKGKNQEMYALLPLEEGEELEESISWTLNPPKNGSKITLLGEKKSLKWTSENGKIHVSIPKSLRDKLSNAPAIVFSYEAE